MIRGLTCGHLAVSWLSYALGKYVFNLLDYFDCFDFFYDTEFDRIGAVWT